MKFCYPVKGVDSLESFYKKREKGGFYPIGRSNVWHGGVHIEGDKEEIRAIADGEIIAFKMPNKYDIEVKDGKNILYSNAFVLIKHKYEYITDKDEKKQLIFYSLYNHLLPYKKEGKDDDKIFEGEDIPSYLKKKEEGYEIVTKALNLRSTEKEEKGTQGKVLKTLSKGTFLKKGILTEAESKEDHWIYDAGNTVDNFKKVTYESDSEKVEGFISVTSTRAKEVTITLNEYDTVKFPFNTVRNCNIEIKAGDKVGYIGHCGTGKSPDYKACHIEVFTVNEDELKAFLAGNIKDEETHRRFFRFDEEVNLQRNYPVKIKGNWEVQLQEKGTSFSKIKIRCTSLRKTVDYSNLIDLQSAGRNGYYKIKEGDGFTKVNTEFGGVLEQDTILSYVSMVKDEKGKRVAAISYEQKPNIFWIANDKVNGKNKDDIFELEESSFGKLYDSEKEPTDTQDIKIAAEVIIKGYLKKMEVDKEIWFQLASGKEKGWIKDGVKGCARISAYKWKEWKFTDPIKDDPDDFIFDGNESGAFMKGIIEKIDKDKDDEITITELEDAIKDRTIARKLGGIICYHKTDWAGPETADPYVKELEEMINKAINDPAINESRKKRLEELKPERLEILKERITASGFWKEITALKDNTEVYYFHPIAFIEQMNRMVQWHEPVDNPQITIYTQGGNERPWRSSFGYTRKDISANHRGLDIFALEDTNIYACLDSVVVGVEEQGGYGKILILKVKDVDSFCARRLDYELAYKNDGEYEGISKSNEVYLRYAHLSKISVKNGDDVTIGTAVGKTGTTGVSGGTCGPHVHFEISSCKYPGSFSDRYNPGYYVNYKTENMMSDDEKKIQENRKNEGQK